MLIDSHAHLDFEHFERDLDGVVARARAAGLERIVCVGLWRKPGDFGNALELAARDPSFFAATVGVHPHEPAEVPEEDWAALARLARDPRVVAVGEMGLDFHYDRSPRPVQEAAFRRSLRLAREVAKPIVVHQFVAQLEALRTPEPEPQHPRAPTREAANQPPRPAPEPQMTPPKPHTTLGRGISRFSRDRR